MAFTPRLTVMMMTGLLGLAMPASEARAASLSVNPIRVQLSKRTPSALLTLRNDGSTPTRVQVSAHAWDQGLGGEMDLRPTTDLVFFPSLMVLEPGQSRTIRVGTTRSFGAVERAYRIFVEELPPAATDEQPASAVRMYTRLGIPVFLQPDRPELKAALSRPSMGNGELTFRLLNAGTRHFIPESVVVRGVSASGDSAFAQTLSGWYILAGGAREFSVPLAAPECSRIRSLVIEAQVDGVTLKEQLDTPQGTCRP